MGIFQKNHNGCRHPWSVDAGNIYKKTIGLVDLSDLNNVQFAQVNGDEMMYAASLPRFENQITGLQPGPLSA